MDFSAIEFNPFAVPNDKFMWDYYDKLQRRTAFSQLPTQYIDFDQIPELLRDVRGITFEDLDKLVKFTIVFVDPFSPLWDERDFEARKVTALRYLGFKQEEPFYKLIANDSWFWHYMMAEYFKYANAISYETWFSTKMSFHSISAKLRKGNISDSHQITMTKTLDDLKVKLIEQEAALFKDAYSLRVVAEMSTQNKIGGYAEKHALNL